MMAACTCALFCSQEIEALLFFPTDGSRTIPVSFISTFCQTKPLRSTSSQIQEVFRMKWSNIFVCMVLVLSLASFSFAKPISVPVPVPFIFAPQAYHGVPVALAPVRDTYVVSTVEGNSGCNSTVIYANARWIQVQSPGNQLFGGQGNLIAGNQMIDTFYFDPIGLVNVSWGSNPYLFNYSYLNGTGLTSSNNNANAYFKNISSWKPVVFWQVPGATCYNWMLASYNNASSFVRFDTAGNNSVAQGKFYFANNASAANLLGASPASYQVAIIYQEDAGTVNTTSSNAVRLAAPIVVFDSLGTVSDTSTYKFLPAGATQAKTYYQGLPVGNYATAQALDVPFITERGTKVAAVSSTGIEYDVAAQIAMPKFYFYGNSTMVNVYSFNTLIGDTLDKSLQNRVTDSASDTYVNSLSAADTGATPLSPVRGTSISSTTGSRLYRIGANEYTGFADYATSDTNAPGFNYTEQQGFWIGSGNGNPVAFDPIDKAVEVNKYDLSAYNAKFLGNNYGIPVCTGNLNASGNWASCNTTFTRSDHDRITVEFMESQWIISSMTPPTAPLASSTAAVAGGEVKLAKEAQYGILNVGGVINGGQLKAQLVNVSSSSGNPAIFNILDMGNMVVGQIQVMPGTTYIYTQSGTGYTIKVHVYQTALGMVPNATWAETTIYTEEITLHDGARYNLVSSSDPNKDMYVSLLWKNRDYTSGGSTQPDSLREITVYQYQNFQKALQGDVCSILSTGPFHLKYTGIVMV